MDRDLFSYIAHASHDFCNPMGEETAAAILDQLDPQSAARCLDVGAGKGELLLRILETRGDIGVAVERSRRLCGELRLRASGRVSLGADPPDDDSARPYLQVLERDAAEALDAMPDARFTLSLCLGSSHALGGMLPTVDRLGGIASPGGWLLLGEGYWKRPPDPGYLEALGADPDDLLTHEGTLAALRDRGLRVRWSRVASDEEWESYETRYAQNVFAFLEQNPDHAHAEAMRARITSWQETVRRWGLSTLGFGFVLLETSGAQS